MSSEMVSDLYKDWLSGKTVEEIRHKVKLPNGKTPKMITVYSWLRKKYGSKACNFRANSLRRSLLEDIRKGKIRIPEDQREEVMAWVMTAEEDSTNTYYSENYLKGKMSRNMEFKPEMAIAQPEEDVKIYQLIDHDGKVWSESEDFNSLYLPCMEIRNGQVRVYKQLDNFLAIWIYLYPACKLIDAP